MIAFNWNMFRFDKPKDKQIIQYIEKESLY